MTQEQVPRPQSRSADDGHVADRLQQLSSNEVERVLARAIELQSESEVDRPEVFDAVALHKVADELGISHEHLRTALVEELIRLEAEEPDWIDRLVAPDRITAYATVEGDRDTIRRRLDHWLATNEGLRRQGETSTGVAWAADGRFLTRVRMKLGSAQGDGSLRAARTVSDSVRPVMDGRSLVAVEADTSNVRRLAIGLLVGGAAAGVAVAGVTGVVGQSGFGPEQLAAGVGTFGLVAGGVWIGIRMWADKIKRGLQRTLHAVTMPVPERRSGGLFDIVDHVVSLVDEVKTTYGFRRK